MPQETGKPFAPDERLTEIFLTILDDYIPDNPGDRILAARLAFEVERAGWREITHEKVEAAMNAVPNLGVEAYEPTVTELQVALLGGYSETLGRA